MARASKMLGVIDRVTCKKTAFKMFAAFLIITLLSTAYCIPVEEQVPAEANVKEQSLPQPTILEEEPKLVNPVIPQLPPQENSPLPKEGGTPGALPEDLPASSDGNSENQPGNSDLDTDATFWGGYGGWGYRRPYYGWRGYYGSPWRRWGGYGYGGRSYGGGWGWGGGWGGWGGRGWGGGYWG